MQTIAFLSQKGGSGKSTTAAALAYAARQKGLSVVILDTDPQATLSRWGRRRGEDAEFIARGVLEADLPDMVETAKQGGADLIIIDTAGNANSAAIKAAKLADLVLIPSPPNRVDLETLETSKEMVAMAGNPAAYVVLTKVAHHELDELADVKTVIARKWGLEVAPVFTALRKAYGKGMASNLSPQEIERDGKVATEINALLDFVNNSTSKQLKKKRA
jgi:chromosome partitioning protein